MKKYLAFILLLLLLSCKDQLYEEINQYVVIDKEQEKTDLLSGIYSRLVRIHDDSYFSLLSRADDVNEYNNYSFFSKEGFPMSGGSMGGCSRTGGTGPTASYTGEIYVNLYTAIICANNLICELDATNDKYMLGEAYFLRAYCYYKLAHFFGRPPLVVDTDVNYLLPKPSYAEVYQLMESDLKEAIDLLPETYTLARIPFETPHQGIAKALLAEVYLSMAGYPVNDESKYAEAAKLAGEVMDKAEYYGFELIPDLAKLTTKSDQHCPEHMFSLFIKNTNEPYSRPIHGAHVTFHSIIGLDDEQIYVNSRYGIEFKFFKDYPMSYRKKVFINMGEYYYKTYNTPDSTINVLHIDIEDPLVNPCTYINNVFYLKWTILADYTEGDDVVSYSGGAYATIPLLRYAQTVLTYAEAKARAGQLDQTAYEAINMIRRRANKQDINIPSAFDLTPNLTTQQFLDSVVWERAWELCFEPNGRWFDIIRLNLKDKLADYRYSFDFPSRFSSSLLTDDWYFFKIPQEDRWLNPNLE